jgi:hypothetical protein
MTRAIADSNEFNLDPNVKLNHGELLMKVNIYGKISEVRNIPTRTGRKAVAFLIGTRRCIAFTYVAGAFEYLSGEVVSAAAGKGSF